MTSCLPRPPLPTPHDVPHPLACSLLSYIAAHALSTALLAAAIAALGHTLRYPSPVLTPARDSLATHGTFAAYWLILGVLSSIGLGSGLHTFVLFLGPHIVRVASAAVLHRNTTFSAAIDSFFKWPGGWDVAELSEAFSPNYAHDAWEPRGGEGSGDVGAGGNTFLAIAAKVALPAFLWGLGTALGELPPYFVARAAARSGQSLDELEEVDALEAADRTNSDGGGRGQRGGGVGLVGRAKIAVYESVQRYGFIAILLAASIPNPVSGG